MSQGDRLVSVGRVGRVHGLDGSFYVVGASHPLPEGASVTVAGTPRRIERRGGTAEAPLVRLSGIADRDAVSALQGETLLMPLEDAPLETDEWLAEDLVGCEVPGLGKVQRIVTAPSCDLLEVGPDAVLIPFISDAITNIDLGARRIDVDASFLALDEGDEAQ